MQAITVSNTLDLALEQKAALEAKGIKAQIKESSTGYGFTVLCSKEEYHKLGRMKYNISHLA